MVYNLMLDQNSVSVTVLAEIIGIGIGKIYSKPSYFASLGEKIHRSHL